ncbi:PREDICTED: vegetative cell wall protein gp1-like [Ficedula albicollis]|uniref:vegetative cell wall protein gp1-like n=1 Tax=Ficedula albicollis TaxID=59894 RepID=UPI000359E8DA|nr:PREDICTED: vegetative cell wall protein gp1-like [Ficedula albicollis]
MLLWGHAGPAFVTARPRRACNRHCRATRHYTQSGGCAGPTASAVEPCRTHSRWHAALQDLQQCCRAMQDPQCPPCPTQDRTPTAMPAPPTGSWGRAGSDSSRQDLCPVQQSWATLCHPAPGASRSPEPGASPSPSCLATFTPRQSQAPRRPHRSRPRQLSSPCPPHPEGPPSPQ